MQVLNLSLFTCTKNTIRAGRFPNYISYENRIFIFVIIKKLRTTKLDITHYPSGEAYVT